MIKENFDEVWKTIDTKLKRELQDYFKKPTERNSCYMVGYLGALAANNLIQRDSYTYLMALSCRALESTQVRNSALEWSK